MRRKRSQSPAQLAEQNLYFPSLLGKSWQLVRAVPPWGWLLTVSALWHFFILSHAKPNLFPDTGSFTLLAEAIRDGKWQSGFTFRTPGYPFFLYLTFLLAGWKNFTAVMIAQACLGTTIPVLLYALYRLITPKRWLAWVGGTAFLLDRFSIGLETVPLSEFLCGYTIILALVAFVYGLQTRKLWWAGAAGCLAGINFLVRPTFQYVYLAWSLAALVLCWRELVSREEKQRLLKWLTVYFGVFASIYGLWSSVVWLHTGVFAPSLQLGASMTNHTGAFMELAPDKYSTIRDLYVAEREKRNGDHINLFDQAGWKIAEATSMTLWQLSLKFKEINTYLILHYPGRYLSQVSKAWDRFWVEDSCYITDLTDPYATGSPITLTAFLRFVAENPVTRALYSLAENLLWAQPQVLRFVPWLLIVSLVIVLWLGRRECIGRLTAVLIVGTVFYHVLVHVMVQFTEFGRYKLPVQGLWFSFLFFSVAVSLDWLLRRLKREFVGTTSENPW